MARMALAVVRRHHADPRSAARNWTNSDRSNCESSFARSLAGSVALEDEQLKRNQRDLAHKQATIDKLTHENAVLKRMKFAATSEAFQGEQNTAHAGA